MKTSFATLSTDELRLTTGGEALRVATPRVGGLSALGLGRDPFTTAKPPKPINPWFPRTR